MKVDVIDNHRHILGAEIMCNPTRLFKNGPQSYGGGTRRPPLTLSVAMALVERHMVLIMLDPVDSRATLDSVV